MPQTPTPLANSTTTERRNSSSRPKPTAKQAIQKIGVFLVSTTVAI